MAAVRSPQRSRVFQELDESLNKYRLFLSPSIVFLILYFPIGLILFVIRFSMLLQALVILYLIPKGTVQRFLLRILFGVMGLIVIHKDFRKRSLSARMLVCNKISNLDHISIHLTMSCTTTSLVGDEPLFSYLFYHHHFNTDQLTEIENQLQQVPEFDDSVSIPDSAAVPYIAQPEDVPSNGKKLFNFKVWPFTVENIIQPISLSSWRPFNIPLSVIDSTGWTDLLWVMFLPFTIVDVKMLSPVDSDGTKSPEEFSKKVQKQMATTLNIACTSATSTDIKNWKEESEAPSVTKKERRVGPIISESDFSSVIQPPSDVEEMVYQVIGVLPHVPAYIARQDLMKTRSVDVTVTNLLEGRIKYDPVSIEYDNGTGQPSLSRSTRQQMAKPSIEESHKTFQERKKSLLENARRNYIMKHGHEQT